MEKEIICLLTRIATALETIAQNTSSPNQRTFGVKEIKKEDQFFEVKENEPVTSSIVSLAENEIQDRKNIILNFFNNKKIEIQDYSVIEDDDMKHLSMFIGEKYECIKDFWIQVKRSINNGCSNSSMDLTFINSNKLSDVCQIATLLYDKGYLAEKKYFRSPIRKLNFKVSDDCITKEYLLGKWLEVYLQAKLIESMGVLMNKIDKTIKYSYLSNLKVVFNGGRHAEFDLIFEIAGKIILFEAKTHNLDKTTALEVFKKNNDYAKYLGLNNRSAFIVHTHPENYYIANLKKDCDSLSVISLEEFRESVTNIIQNRFKF